MERNDSTPSAGEAPNAEASKSRGGGRKRLASGLALLAAFACFTFVGIQGVNATLPTASSSPANGSLGGSESLETAVYGSCPTITDYYTVASGDHTPKGKEGTRVIDIGPNSHPQPSQEYDDRETWLASHSTITTVGKPKWDNVDVLKNAKVSATLKKFADPDTIGLDIKSNANMTETDDWDFATTGTCENCVPGQIGRAEYFVTCRTEMHRKLEYDVRDRLQPGAGPNVSNINYTFKMAITDHNGVDHPIGGGPGAEWVHTISGTPSGPPPNIPLFADASTSSAIEDSYTESTQQFFSLDIGQTKKLSAKASKFYTWLETLYFGGDRDAKFEYDAGDGSTLKSGTKVTALWMVPYCFDNYEDPTNNPATPTVSFPGGGDAMPALEWVAFQRSRQNGNVIGGSECEGTTDPDAMDGTSQSQTAATVIASSSDLASEAAPTNGSWSSGSTTYRVFADGSYREESQFNGTIDNPEPEEDTQICKVCLRVYDECGELIYSCCRTSTSDGAGGYTPTSEGPDCDGEPVKPVPCDPN